MKKIYHYSILTICFALVILLLPGCPDESAFPATADIGYEGFKSDAELFYEFMYRKESLMLNMLNYTSDGFTKPPFEGTVSYDEFEKFFLELEDMNKNSEKYLQAAERLEQSGVLQRPTQTRGLLTSAKGFIMSWMGGSGNRNRERILTVASNLSAKDRSQLYNKLRKGWKDKTTGEADFWEKLEKGDFDNSAGQIFIDFIQDNTNFLLLADEKDLTPHKIVVSEGAKGLEAGADFLFDAGASIVPGAGTGMTVIKVSDNLEKMAKSESWKEAAEHGFNAAGDVLEEVTGGIGYTGFNASDVVAAIRNKMDDLFFKKDDKNETKGKVTVKDKNPQTQKPIVIAQKKGGATSSDGSPSVYVTGKEYISKGVDLLIKAGNWLVTLVNSDGFRETVEVKVEPGKVTVVEIDTSPPKEEEPSSDDDAYKFYQLWFSISVSGIIRKTDSFEGSTSEYDSGCYMQFIFEEDSIKNTPPFYSAKSNNPPHYGGEASFKFNSSNLTIESGSFHREYRQTYEGSDDFTEDYIESFKIKDIPFYVFDDNVHLLSTFDSNEDVKDKITDVIYKKRQESTDRYGEKVITTEELIKITEINVFITLQFVDI